MHILFLSDNFPPEVNAPASRTFEHCREWVKQGHEVTVITCVPNFPKGEVYAGYYNKTFDPLLFSAILWWAPHADNYNSRATLPSNLSK